MSDRELLKTKTYTITLNEYNDDKTELIRRNDGFNPLELLGLCSLSTQEIIEQLKGDIKPDVIRREVVK
jgi:hypothetical protein